MASATCNASTGSLPRGRRSSERFRHPVVAARTQWESPCRGGMEMHPLLVEGAVTAQLRVSEIRVDTLPLTESRRLTRPRRRDPHAKRQRDRSPVGAPTSSAMENASNSTTKRSRRSSSGLDIWLWYRSTWSGVQWQGRRRSPHGHGFIAPTSRNRAGKLMVRAAREIRTTPSSSGSRNASSGRRSNSSISSKKMNAVVGKICRVASAADKRGARHGV